VYWPQYCEIIFICCLFNFVFFVRRAVHKFKIPPNYLLISYIAYSLISMNISVHEHVCCHQTTKFCANEIKWFHSNLKMVDKCLINGVKSNHPLMVSPLFTGWQCMVSRCYWWGPSPRSFPSNPHMWSSSPASGKLCEGIEAKQGSNQSYARYLLCIIYVVFRYMYIFVCWFF